MSKGGEESFYGPMVLIKNFLGTYFAATKYTIIILLLIAVVAIIANFIRKRIFYNKWILKSPAMASFWVYSFCSLKEQLTMKLYCTFFQALF